MDGQRNRCNEKENLGNVRSDDTVDGRIGVFVAIFSFVLNLNDIVTEQLP